MHKKIKALLLTIMMVSTFTVTTFATTIQQQKQKIEQSQKNKQETESKSKENLTLEQQAQKKLQGLEEKIEIMDSKISGKQIRINEANTLIAKTNEKISRGKLELDKAQADMEKEQEVFGERASALYMNGTGSKFQLLIEADGFFDLISRMQTLKDISEHDNNVMEQLTATKEKVQAKQKSLQVEKSRLLSIKNENQKDLQTILNDKKEVNVIVAKAQKERDHYASISKSYRDQIARENREIARALAAIESIKNPPKHTDASRSEVNIPSNMPKDKLRNLVVQTACGYRGIPYKWGGTRPDGFDCSGFVQYVYKQFGYGIDRVTTDQVHNGRAVSRGNLQPGDLIFFGSASAPHHVGMYIGNKQYIHAPQTGDVIKISSLLYRNYSAARRIIN